MKKLEEYVVSIPDYPEKGIIFRDVTSILEDPEGLQLSIRELQDKLEGMDFNIVIGPESRGFIFGMPIAYNLQKAFVPIRKKGKLPCETASIKYDLEYGSAEAMIKLIEGLGGEVVEVLCLIELMGLKGREKLKGYKVDSVIQYPGN